MTPGEPTEQLPRTPGPTNTPPRPSVAATSRIPLRPEDVERARAEAKSAKAAAAVAASSAGGGASRPAGATPGKGPGGAKGTSGPAGTTSPAGAGAKAANNRRVQLTVSRIDPWSALKMSFLLSVSLGIAMVVATAALWLILAGTGAFDQVNNLTGQIVQDGGNKFDIMDYVGFGRVVSLSIVFAVIDVFLWMAIATLGAFIYNVSSSLVGGLHLTLTDD